MGRLDDSIEERFRRKLGDTTGDERYLLSDDRCMGYLLQFDKDCYYELGRVKLLKRPHGYIQVSPTKSLALTYLYRVLNVIRRRKIFTFGFYNLGGGWVYCIREKDNYILIAPAFYEQKYPDSDFSTILSSKTYNKRLKEFQTWSTILGEK